MSSSTGEHPSESTPRPDGPSAAGAPGSGAGSIASSGASLETELKACNASLLARQRSGLELQRTEASLEERTRELDAANALLASTLECAGEGILAIDASGQAIFANTAFLTLWRASRADFEHADFGRIAVLVSSFLFEPDAAIRRFNDIHASERPDTLDILKLRDGRTIRCSSRLSATGTTRVGRVWTFQDATERLQAETALRQDAEERRRLLEIERIARAEAERVSLQKDQFLTTLSHELRTPLNAIGGWAQILRARSNLDAETREGIEVIARNARVQTQLIEDLLDMSRVASGAVRLDMQITGLKDLVDAAVASVRQSAEARSIRVQVVADASAGPVRGDPVRLQQCVGNLLANAIKFTPRGGRIHVALSRVESHAEIRVTDNGEGISAEFLPHVFERFRQGDSSSTRRHGGLGVGLSIVRHLVELHGGRVRAASPGLGRGSTFTIELPIAVAHDGNANPAQSGANPSLSFARDHPSLEGVTVLVVDDEPDARGLVKRVLEDCGAKVVVADSAASAYRLVQEHRPSMILSDIGMPQEDGYDFIRRVRQLAPEKGGRTPAAAVTAFARGEDRTKALRAGFQTHVAKPVEPLELTAVVASLAGRH